MNKTIIIAEAGVNHNGSLELAKKLIDAAASAKVDFVKFQTFKTENVITQAAKKAEYQNKSTSSSESQFDMVKKLELTAEDHDILIAYCKTKKINFLSTGFDLESLELLNNLKIPFFKIPSGEITNLPYLRKVASFKKPIILSTGMAELQEVKDAFQVLIKEGISSSDITVLHCNTEYPTPMQDVNLKAMNIIGKELGVKIGYSDHTLGIEIPIAAVALGAIVIEKHFTLDRNMEGPDHKASLEPQELKYMVTAIRNVEKAIAGSGMKEPSPSEIKNKAVVRKSIIALKPILKGEKFTEDNLGIKRPGTGISPMQWDLVLGTNAVRDFKEEELIEID